MTTILDLIAALLALSGLVAAAEPEPAPAPVPAVSASEAPAQPEQERVRTTGTSAGGVVILEEDGTVDEIVVTVDDPIAMTLEAPDHGSLQDDGEGGCYLLTPEGGAYSHASVPCEELNRSDQ